MALVPIAFAMQEAFKVLNIYMETVFFSHNLTFIEHTFCLL